MSAGITDTELWRTVEPGTPAPERRLEAVRTLSENGIDCAVLMAPVIPFLGNHPDQLRATVRAIAASGATSVTPLVLHLRPGAREWLMSRLAEHHPHLVRRYERLYAEGAYAPKWYRRRVTHQVHEPAEEFGIGPSRPGRPAVSASRSSRVHRARRPRSSPAPVPARGHRSAALHHARWPPNGRTPPNSCDETLI